MHKEFEPDIIDLNDWMSATKPDIYSATKYLSDTEKVYLFWLKIWKEAGRPNLD